MGRALPSGQEHERRLALFGSRVRILVGPPDEPGVPRPESAARVAEAVLRLFQARLSRFDPESELSRLNCDPREVVPVSALLAGAVSAALRAAEYTDGLVDPTLLGALEDAGYAASRAGVAPAPLGEALRSAPPRAPAAPAASSAWQAVSVEGLRVRRPPGTRIDLGGTAKGLAADVCAERLAGYRSFAVDACGDVRIGGAVPAQRLVEVDHPLKPAAAHRFHVAQGAAATSGIANRIWRSGEGGFAHHLIDPACGEPAWTGVIQATALAPTALEAEVLAKAALLSGPDAGRRALTTHGGVLVLDDGEVLPVEAHVKAGEAVAA
jgi:thiamine biosynthesis lipoprotein